mmetsp:Transcript_19073/g.48571  ORF Transcript_19073/g.48571 Transcript_19073/m.48571 type:complete len:287 (+) Transcript_19073:252-1112(+)
MFDRAARAQSVAARPPPRLGPRSLSRALAYWIKLAALGLLKLLLDDLLPGLRRLRAAQPRAAINDEVRDAAHAAAEELHLRERLLLHPLGVGQHALRVGHAHGQGSREQHLGIGHVARALKVVEEQHVHQLVLHLRTARLLRVRQQAMRLEGIAREAVERVFDAHLLEARGHGAGRPEYRGSALGPKLPRVGLVLRHALGRGLCVELEGPPGDAHLGLLGEALGRALNVALAEQAVGSHDVGHGLNLNEHAPGRGRSACRCHGPGEGGEEAEAHRLPAHPRLIKSA